MEDALERWRSEKTAAYLSSAVAAAERDPAKATLFREMAEAAETQAGILAKELKPVPAFEPSLRSRLTASLIGIFGPRAVRPRLVGVEGARRLGLSRQARRARGSSLADLGRGSRAPPQILWRRHARAGVFGVNDGLVSNTCLVMGVAGAEADSSVLILHRRGGAARRRLLHGGGRVHLHAVAEGDVRASNLAREGRA